MNRWTPEQDAWLAAEYPVTQPGDLAALFAGAFGFRRTPKALASRAKVLGLRKAEGYRRRVPGTWPDDRAEWFKAFVPGHTEAEISAEHERLFGFPLTESQIGNAKARYGVRSGTHGGRLEKGRAPANKGKRQSEFMTPEAIARTEGTRFRKGHRPHNAIDGTGQERVNAEGYVEVKVGDGPQDRPNSNWRMKHHVAYEEAHGAIPDGCNVVFADGDKRNFDPGNLVAVPRAAWATVARLGMDYYDRESLEACVARARLHAAMSAGRKRARRGLGTRAEG